MLTGKASLRLPSQGLYSANRAKDVERDIEAHKLLSGDLEVLLNAVHQEIAEFAIQPLAEFLANATSNNPYPIFSRIAAKLQQDLLSTLGQLHDATFPADARIKLLEFTAFNHAETELIYHCRKILRAMDSSLAKDKLTWLQECTATPTYTYTSSTELEKILAERQALFADLEEFLGTPIAALHAVLKDRYASDALIVDKIQEYQVARTRVYDTLAYEEKRLLQENQAQLANANPMAEKHLKARNILKAASAEIKEYLDMLIAFAQQRPLMNKIYKEALNSIVVDTDIAFDVGDPVCLFKSVRDLCHTREALKVISQDFELYMTTNPDQPDVRRITQLRAKGLYIEPNAKDALANLMPEHNIEENPALLALAQIAFKEIERIFGEAIKEFIGFAAAGQLADKLKATKKYNEIRTLANDLHKSVEKSKMIFVSDINLSVVNKAMNLMCLVALIEKSFTDTLANVETTNNFKVEHHLNGVNALRELIQEFSNVLKKLKTLTVENVTDDYEATAKLTQLKEHLVATNDLINGTKASGIIPAIPGVAAIFFGDRTIAEFGPGIQKLVRNIQQACNTINQLVFDKNIVIHERINTFVTEFGKNYPLGQLNFSPAINTLITSVYDATLKLDDAQINLEPVLLALIDNFYHTIVNKIKAKPKGILQTGSSLLKGLTSAMSEQLKLYEVEFLKLLLQLQNVRLPVVNTNFAKLNAKRQTLIEAKIAELRLQAKMHPQASAVAVPVGDIDAEEKSKEVLALKDLFDVDPRAWQAEMSRRYTAELQSELKQVEMVQNRILHNRFQPKPSASEEHINAKAQECYQKITYVIEKYLTMIATIQQQFPHELNTNILNLAEELQRIKENLRSCQALVVPNYEGPYSNTKVSFTQNKMKHRSINASWHILKSFMQAARIAGLELPGQPPCKSIAPMENFFQLFEQAVANKKLSLPAVDGHSDDINLALVKIIEDFCREDLNDVFAALNVLEGLKHSLEVTPHRYPLPARPKKPTSYFAITVEPDENLPNPEGSYFMVEADQPVEEITPINVTENYFAADKVMPTRIDEIREIEQDDQVATSDPIKAEALITISREVFFRNYLPPRPLTEVMVEWYEKNTLDPQQPDTAALTFSRPKTP